MSDFRDNRDDRGGRGAGSDYYDQRQDFSSEPQRQQQQYQGGGDGGFGGGRQSDQQEHRGGQGGGFSLAGFDVSKVVQQAQSHNNKGDNDEESSLFTKAMGFLNENKGRIEKEDIDEQKLVGAHQALYGDGQQGGQRAHDADTIGGGAAMQALKMFMGGEGQGQGGTGDQNKFIGMAMAQAGKMWEQQNQQGNAATDKQSAINKAGQMAMMMYMKKQMQGGAGGGAGGLGGLANLASQFAGSGGKQQSSGGGGSDLLGLAKKFL